MMTQNNAEYPIRKSTHAFLIAFYQDLEHLLR